MRYRWIQLALLVSLISWLIIWIPQDLSKAAVVFPIFCVMGVAIDWLGITKFHLWDYPRQPFRGVAYYILVASSWGLLSVTVNQFWNWLHNWLVISVGLLPGSYSVEKILALLIVYLVFVGGTELPNLKTKTWIYNASWGMVLTGWFPLIGVIRLIYLNTP